MSEEDKNLKDTRSSLPSLPLSKEEKQRGDMSYTKTNKLIIALYMVTDIMEKDEPLRIKLRTLGAEIISDINSVPARALNKISEIISFLDIAGAINLVSEMNRNILKKEFVELKLSLDEKNNPEWLGEFVKDENPQRASIAHRNKNQSIGHTSTRIGVQKASTLMKALSDIKSPKTGENDFNVLKQQRRDEIINIIKNHPDGATITNIRTEVKGSLTSFSEKTLQRELVSMVKDNLLNKTGEKRWSRYYLPK